MIYNVILDSLFCLCSNFVFVTGISIIRNVFSFISSYSLIYSVRLINSLLGILMMLMALMRFSMSHVFNLHCVQKKTPTHNSFYISMNDVSI